MMHQASANEATALLPASRERSASAVSMDVESEYLSEAEYLEAEAEKSARRDEHVKERRRQCFLMSGLSLLIVTLLLVISTQYGDFADRITNGQFFQQIVSAVSSVTKGGSTTTSTSAVSSGIDGGDNSGGGGKVVSTTTKSTPMGGSASAATFDFTMARDGYSELPYFSTDKSDVFKYAILDGYDGVLEPNAANTLVLLDDDSSSDSGTYFLYTVCPPNASSQSECFMGSYSLSGDGPGTMTITPSCAAYDSMSITVDAYDIDSGSTLFSASGTLLCMYVRREIRALSDDDLSRTMDAMYEMWVTTDEDGQEKYGDNYQSAKYLLEYHFFNAAWQDADHIHEGLGFLAQHVKQSLIFETAMQAVDSSVTLPYWDFTIESATNTSIMFSPAFSDKTFGAAPIPADAYWGWTYRISTLSDAAIPNGRWAFTKTEDNTKYSDLNYAYGYIRAPWNMNPSPYLSRFTSTNKHLPTCSSHYQLLAYDSLTDFLSTVPYGAHASTHGVIGGVYGCDLMDPLMDAGLIIDDEAQINLCKNWIFYLKEFYRMDYLKPRTGCYTDNGDTSYDSLHCGFECNSDYSDKMLFDLSKILNSDYDCVPETLTTQQWNTWKDFICVGDGYKIFGGDHLESASPADPSFWPIHPTLERLLQAKYMSGGFEDSTWPTDPQADYVCDKPSCLDDSTGIVDYYSSCCYGHYEHDKLLDAPNANRTGHVGWTNAEIHTGTDPRLASYAMGYIYDSFTWDHCADIGLDFEGLLTDKYEASQKDDEEEEDEDVETDADTEEADADADADTDTDADAEEADADADTEEADADADTEEADADADTEEADADLAAGASGSPNKNDDIEEPPSAVAEDADADVSGTSSLSLSSVLTKDRSVGATTTTTTTTATASKTGPGRR